MLQCFCGHAGHLRGVLDCERAWAPADWGKRKALFLQPLPELLGAAGFNRVGANADAAVRIYGALEKGIAHSQYLPITLADGVLECHIPAYMMAKRIITMGLEWIFIAGFLGGLIRGLMGISKVIRASPSKKKRIRRDYIIFTLLSSGGIGLIVGVFISEDVRFALLAGYAGTDFLENLFKVKMRQKSWE